MGKKKTETKSTVGKPRIRIKLSAYDNKVIDNSTREIMKIISRYNLGTAGPVPLPTEIQRYTVNRSSFIHKDSREQFEIRIHKRLIDIFNPNPKVIESLRDLNLPAGVNIEIKT